MRVDQTLNQNIPRKVFFHHSQFSFPETGKNHISTKQSEWDYGKSEKKLPYNKNLLTLCWKNICQSFTL